MTLWLMVTTDELELPLAVADSKKELAYMINVSDKYINTYVSRQKRGKLKPRFITVDILENE